MKRCIRCEQEKLPSEFCKNKNRPDGLNAYCQACRSAYRKANREKIRATINACRNTKHGKRIMFAQNISRYGLTVEDYARLMYAQARRCALCYTAFTERGRTRPNIDHCHKTKRVRGLICYDCNWGLGTFKDDPEALRRAANYLDDAHKNPTAALPVAA